MSVEIATPESAGFVARRDEVVDVYRAAFAGPPYNETEADAAYFGQRLALHVYLAGFRGVIAEGAAGKVAGFAYGYGCRPGQWWHDVVAEGLGPALAGQWLGDAFELAELAVAPGSQGQGIGGRLHDALLAGAAHRTAVLSTADEATPAHYLYRGRGWLTLLEHFRFPGVARRYAIMGVRLPAAGRDGRARGGRGGAGPAADDL